MLANYNSGNEKVVEGFRGLTFPYGMEFKLARQTDTNTQLNLHNVTQYST